jgi:hypothetical protein
MWRDYYETRFAPDSFRIALAAAEAARAFQPTGSREAVNGALQTQKSPGRCRGF